MKGFSDQWILQIEAASGNIMKFHGCGVLRSNHEYNNIFIHLMKVGGVGRKVEEVLGL